MSPITPAQLPAALAAATGGEVLSLAAGDFGVLKLGATGWKAPVVITSADPGNRAIFAGAELRGTSNLQLVGVNFTQPLPADTGAVCVRIYGGQLLRFIDVVARGTLGPAPFGAVFERRGLFLQAEDFDGLTLERVDIGDFVSGGNVFGRKLDAAGKGLARGFSAYQCDLHDLRKDGFLISGVDGVLLLANHFSGWHVRRDLGDHPDAIQLDGGLNKLACARVTIRHNLIEFTVADRAQGIFGGGTATGRGNEWRITRNLLVNTMDNGIMIKMVDGLVIDDATLLHQPSEGFKSGSMVRVNDVTGTVTNVVAMQPVLTGGPGLPAISACKRSAASTDQEIADAVAAWKAENRPQKAEVATVDPRDAAIIELKDRLFQALSSLSSEQAAKARLEEELAAEKQSAAEAQSALAGQLQDASTRLSAIAELAIQIRALA